MPSVESDYQYLYTGPSTLISKEGSEFDLKLSTSSFDEQAESPENPHFFSGFVDSPVQTAAALLVVAKVARTRFWMPPNMVAARIKAADPVVTSDGERLRFESFSPCCGVYCRFDLLSNGLESPPIKRGTTNVDFNQPMRSALAKVTGSEPLHVSVGEESVTATTLDQTVVEKRVPLPKRWYKGFSEVQAAAAGMELKFEISASEARKFLRLVPKTPGNAKQILWVQAVGRGLRLASKPSAEAACLAGAHRLRTLEPLLKFTKRLRVYGPRLDSNAQQAASAWELELEGARVVLTLSPSLSRGFSGEGGLLFDLADQKDVADVDLVSALFATQPLVAVDELADDGVVSESSLQTTLAYLSASGEVGYDLAEGAYFYRELPYGNYGEPASSPRLDEARRLLQAGAVRIDGEVIYVKGGSSEYIVRLEAEGYACTCPWYAKHKRGRGPCKHILAAQLLTNDQR